MKKTKKKTAKRKKVNPPSLPEILYAEDIGNGEMEFFRTLEEAPADVGEAITVGIYKLQHFARISHEIKVKVVKCGPSKARR